MRLPRRRRTRRRQLLHCSWCRCGVPRWCAQAQLERLISTVDAQLRTLSVGQSDLVTARHSVHWGPDATVPSLEDVKAALAEQGAQIRALFDALSRQTTARRGSGDGSGDAEALRATVEGIASEVAALLSRLSASEASLRGDIASKADKRELDGAMTALEHKADDAAVLTQLEWKADKILLEKV